MLTQSQPAVRKSLRLNKSLKNVLNNASSDLTLFIFYVKLFRYVKHNGGMVDAQILMEEGAKETCALVLRSAHSVLVSVVCIPQIYF